MTDVVEALLLKLKQGGYLKPGGAGYVVVGLRGARKTVTAEMVQTQLARGLLRTEAGKIVLSKAGEAWLEKGARFAEQHQLLTTACLKDERGRDTYVVMNAAESPLALLQRLGWITAAECEAGEKLRRDYTIGQLTPRQGVNYAAPAGPRSHRTDMAETVLAARQRFNAALKAAGPGLADILFDVCCYLKGLEESEKTRSWPRGSAKVVLRLGLERLVAHYGFGAPESARMRSWNKDDEDVP